MNYKKSILSFYLICFLCLPVCAKVIPIDAEKNAQSRNNSGVEYMRDKDYNAAIKEFKIAIAINPNHQTSAVYYNNLGRAYIEISKIQKQNGAKKQSVSFAKYAEISFKSAINLDCMQLNFYKNLVESFSLQGNLSSKKKEYAKNASDPFNLIIVALIDEKTGNKKNAQIALDDFINRYPDLIITIALKDYLKKM